MLGVKLLGLTGHYLASLDIVRAGRLALHELVEKTNEDAEIVVMKGIEIVFVCKEQCSHPLKYSIEIGDRAPMYPTAAGRAILAHLSEIELSRYFSAVTSVSLTKNTITDPELLKREFEDVRSKGIAYGREENQEGITGIAAPIFNFRGKVEGSVVVTLPSIRFSSKQKRFIEPRLCSAAAEISRQLGFDADSSDIGSNRRKRKVYSPS
jgi:IclR family KDG regulon transcriptional repressor